MPEPLRVIINAQLSGDGASGGVEHFTVSLIRALGQLEGDEQYVVVGQCGNSEWLRPHLGKNQRLVEGPSRPTTSRNEGLKRLLGPARRHLAKLYHKTIKSDEAVAPTVPRSDGFFERLEAQVIHFPYQVFVFTDLHSIYTPHDLQYRHLPQFFSRQEWLNRDTMQSTGCRNATAVTVDASYAVSDVAQEFGVDRSKIYSILFSPPTAFYEPVSDATIARVRTELKLPDRFVLFPAQTWPHKNHIRLLEALADLKQRGVAVPLVSSGRKNEHWPVIEARIKELGLTDQTHFLGYVSAEQLRAMYHLAQFVVFPSLFEGGGFPVIEAFLEGTAVACSNVTSLPEYGGDAVLLFDPNSTTSIADAVARLWADDAMRADLRARGSQRVATFSWDTTALTYRALYRKVTGRMLTDEDRELLGKASGGS
jgi:glycosyltransferase involved in cell wall biosynthesis